MARIMRSRAAVWIAAVAVVVIPLLMFTNVIPGSPATTGLLTFSGMVLYVVFWAAIIAGGIWLAREFGWLKGVGRLGKDDATAELRRRYARGEVTRAEYFQIKQDLEADSDTGTSRSG